MTTPEGKIKAKVNAALDAMDTTWRFMPVQNGMGKPGLDYFICCKGMFVAIETKTPGKELTERQKATAMEIKRAHGSVFVIRGQNDLTYMMHCLGRGFLEQATIYDTMSWETKSHGRATVDQTARGPRNNLRRGQRHRRVSAGGHHARATRRG